MKRLLALLFVAALLLSGCTDKSTPQTTAPAETPAPQTSANAETPSSEAPEPAETTPIDYAASYPDPIDEYGNPSFTVPASPADPDTVPASPADPELSATGATNPVAPARPSASKVRVYTDDSKYTAFKLPQAKYTRLREEPMTEFQPMEGLGAVMPYVAAPIFSRGEGGWSRLSGYHMGLMDKTGRLLTDGIYIRVEPVEYMDYRGETARFTPLPYWDVARIENVRTYTEGDGEDTWTYSDGDMLHGLVSKDGSFATPVQYRGIHAQPECVIAYLDWEEPWNFDVYDLQGKLLFSGKDLPKRSTDGYDLEYGEGLFAASWYNWDDEENSAQCVFLDRSGKQVLGPYVTGSAFHDGLACVSTDGETSGYIDKTGAWVIEPRFDTTADFRDGRAIQEKDGTALVIDKTGREIFRAEPGMILSAASFGYVGNCEDRQVFYDLAGKELMRTEENQFWYPCVKDEIFSRSDNGSVTLFSVLEPEKTYTARGSYAQPAYALKDGKPVAGFEIVDYEAGSYQFVTEDLSEGWELTEEAPNNYTMMGYRETIDPITGKTVKMTADRGRISVFDETQKLLGVFPRNTDVQVVGGMLRTLTDFACTYTDPAGNVVFCYPLMTLMDD